MGMISFVPAMVVVHEQHRRQREAAEHEKRGKHGSPETALGSLAIPPNPKLLIYEDAVRRFQQLFERAEMSSVTERLLDCANRVETRFPGQSGLLATSNGRRSTAGETADQQAIELLAEKEAAVNTVNRQAHLIACQVAERHPELLRAVLKEMIPEPRGVLARITAGCRAWSIESKSLPALVEDFVKNFSEYRYGQESRALRLAQILKESRLTQG